jgi:transcriptional regulator with XRE-family HTH domain
MGTIGNALQELRAERRLSATEAAAGAGTTVSTYLKIERDRREVSFIMMVRLCRFYNLDIYEFLERIDSYELERPDLSVIRVLEKRNKS